MIPMRYELYVDSLFLMNFCMNLYLLMLVGHSIPGTATPWRLITAAAAGALSFLLPFFGDASGAVKLAVCGSVGTAGMLCIAFDVRSFRMFLKLLEKLLIYSFGIGGGLLFLIARVPFLRSFLTAGCGVLCVGGILFLLFGNFHGRKDAENHICRAVLMRGGECVKTAALLDSGNSLTEPISGKPVCVIDGGLFRELWGEETTGYRAIPYHSVGKRRGIMEGYLLEKLFLETEGVKLKFENVYVAVSKEPICGEGDAEGESVKMIINPELFAGSRTGRLRKRQIERKYDSKSGNTGNDAVKGDAQGKCAFTQKE